MEKQRRGDAAKLGTAAEREDSRDGARGKSTDKLRTAAPGGAAVLKLAGRGRGRAACLLKPRGWRETLFGVVVEALARLFAQQAAADHLFQQQGGDRKSVV